MFKKFMSKKSNKKRGFTLIELIIVIAIIAILAAIAVPAFGQIRQKANESADLGNARTIYSLVATKIAEDDLDLPGQYGDSKDEEEYYYSLVGAEIEMDPTPVVKQKQNAYFVIKVDGEGSIEIGYASEEADGTSAEPDDYVKIYPEDSAN